MGQGMEIFTREKKSYFFNMLTENAFNSFFNAFKNIVTRINKGNKRGIDVVEDAKTEFKNRKILEAWNSKEIST